MTNSADNFDVAIVGGGPAGSTAAALLRKYKPDLRVAVIEKEIFPRDHIGESQLPACSGVLDEMGVWDKVEAAGFPVKIGASLTWGADQESWDFDFIAVEDFVDQARPAKFAGQRSQTAFQVDRSIYDKILLDHASACGAIVHQPARVSDINIEGKDTPEARINSLALSDGRRVTATWYVDASGNVGLLRRALGIETRGPKVLRNLAFWDYWENAKWAVNIGVGATRIQIRSLPYGWLWFIPLGPTRTSIGLVCPSEYYLRCGKTPEELYYNAIKTHPQLSELIAGATPRGTVESTRDWSHVSDRVSGPNWILCGEAAGFADPILSAGMTLAHQSARETSYIILESYKDGADVPWLLKWYDEKTRTNIQQHIRFAEYWYASNGCLTDLKEHCAKIAKDSGLRLAPDSAWAWLAQGGFSHMTPGRTGLGSFDVPSARKLVEKFVGPIGPFNLEKYTALKLNLVGAKPGQAAEVYRGGVRKVQCLRRGPHVLPQTGLYNNVISILKRSRDAGEIFSILKRSIAAQFPQDQWDLVMSDHMFAIETMIMDGWIEGKKDPKHGWIKVDTQGSRSIRDSKEGLEALARRDEREKARGTGRA